MKINKIKELLKKATNDIRTDKKKMILTTVAGVAVVSAVGAACVYGLNAHNAKAEKAKIEASLQAEKKAELASLKQEVDGLNIESLDETAQAKFNEIKEKFMKAVAEENVTLAKQELASLKDICNSKQNETLAEESTSENTEEENVENNNNEVVQNDSNSTDNHDNNHEEEVVVNNTVAVGGNTSSKPVNSNSNNTNTSNSGSNNTTTNKPSNSSSNTVVNKPSTGNTNNSNSSSGTTTPVHNHTWVEVYKDVVHPEEGRWDNVCVKQAWTETVPVYESQIRAICNGCGKDVTNDPFTHMKQEMLNGNLACGGYHSERRDVQTGTKTVQHDAVYEKKWVVTKPSWIEKVLTGYKCNSCGATK